MTANDASTFSGGKNCGNNARIAAVINSRSAGRSAVVAKRCVNMPVLSTKKPDAAASCGPAQEGHHGTFRGAQTLGLAARGLQHLFSLFQRRQNSRMDITFAADRGGIAQ